MTAPQRAGGPGRCGAHRGGPRGCRPATCCGWWLATWCRRTRASCAARRSRWTRPRSLESQCRWRRQPGSCHGADTPLADRAGMVHAGTVITRGRADAVVTGTGSALRSAPSPSLLDERRVPLTPLQRRLARLGRQLSLERLCSAWSWPLWACCGGNRSRTWLVTAVSLAVAAIPESLPAVVSLSLALGAQRMASRGALIRQLPAVETLGSVTVIASDKTGTLTEGMMAVERLWTPTASWPSPAAGYAPGATVRVSPSAAGELPPQDAARPCWPPGRCATTPGLPATRGGRRLGGGRRSHRGGPAGRGGPGRSRPGPTADASLSAVRRSALRLRSEPG